MHNTFPRFSFFVGIHRRLLAGDASFACERSKGVHNVEPSLDRGENDVAADEVRVIRLWAAEDRRATVMSAMSAVVVAHARQ